MSKGLQQALLVLVLVLLAGVVVAKVAYKAPTPEPVAAGGDAATVATGATCPTLPHKGGEAAHAPAPVAAPPAKGQAASLPRLVDLGSVGCIPCEKMKPVLAELNTELQGKVSVEFIDIYKDTTAADKYAIQVIPTQVFLDAGGKELFRHQGFFPKADILAKMAELKMTKGVS